MLDAKTFVRAVATRPAWVFLPLIERGWLGWLDDEMYLRFSSWVMLGRPLNLRHPITFNDKIGWLKINDRKPIYRIMADKCRARSFVEKTVGALWLLPLLGTWDDVEQIDFERLPDKFVLKCTKGNGGVAICSDRSSFDEERARLRLARALEKDYYMAAREWAYKSAGPRIMAEAFVGGGAAARPADYKFMVMNGKVKLVCVSRGLGDLETGAVSFFLPDGTPAPFKRADYPECSADLVIDEEYLRMYEAAERLAVASDAVFLRVDFLRGRKRAYFSEFTFYPCGGSVFFDPPAYDALVGSLLELPETGYAR